MKKEIAFVLLYVILSASAEAQPMSLRWVNSIGNANNTEQNNGVAIDLDKNVFIAGTFTGTVDFNPSSTGTTNLTSSGSYSAFVAKFDSTGNFIWAKSFGGSAYAHPASIITDDSGNVIIAGTFFNTVDFDPSASTYELESMGTGGGLQNLPVPSIFVQKLNTSGDFVWAIRIGSNGPGLAGGGSANSVTTDHSKNVYLAGGINPNGTLDFDPGPATVNSTSGKAFLAKYDTGGNLGWVSTFGNIGGLGAVSNDVYFSQDYLYVTGLTTTGVGSIGQLLVRKIDLFGIGIWEKRIAGGNNVSGNSIAVDDAGTVITVGNFIQSSAIDFDPGPNSFLLDPANGRQFIQKLDAAGDFLWAKNFNSNPTTVAIDIDNNIYIAGSFSGTTNFGTNGATHNLTTTGNASYIQKLDANGYFLWAGQLGNSGDGIVRSMVSDSVRNVYLAGYFSGTQDFDPNPSPSKIFNVSSISGTRDAYVVKLKDPKAFITKANGNWNDATTWIGNEVPPINAAVIARHTVQVTANATCYSLIIEMPNGFVNVKTGVHLVLSQE